MGNFPLTRTALNLLLIVALAIQPVAACAVTADCSVRCSESDTFMCPGCGCCEVEQANDRCCCCSGTAKVTETKSAKPSCCSHDQSSDSDVFGAPRADLESPERACEISDSEEFEDNSSIDLLVRAKLATSERFVPNEAGQRKPS